MSGDGAPAVIVEPGSGAGLRIAVIASSWHPGVMAGLLAGSRRALAAAGVTDVTEVRIAGSF